MSGKKLATGTVHLSMGSEKPPRVEGKIRLYSMKYCPFSHRVRLALTYKKIPHEIVNINLMNKPDWYLQIDSDGKVPALIDLDETVVVDSVVIVNYLEEKYPDVPLYNKETMEQDLQLLDMFDKVVKIFLNCIHKKDQRPLRDIVNDIYSNMKPFEEELKTRNTSFFTGNKPGMLDILMWPFVERAKALPLLYNETLEFDKSEFPYTMKWILQMKKQDFVKANAECHKKFAKVVEGSNSGNINYDDIN